VCNAKIYFSPLHGYDFVPQRPAPDHKIAVYRETEIKGEEFIRSFGTLDELTDFLERTDLHVFVRLVQKE